MRTYEELIEDEDLDLENSAEDQFAYGMCFLEGYGCEKNLEKAVKWLENPVQVDMSLQGNNCKIYIRRKRRYQKRKQKTTVL